MEGFLTEIRTFYSLREIRESIEAEIAQYKLLLEDYSQWLGTLLRNPEISKNQEWAKKMAELQKLYKMGGRKGGKKEGKAPATSTEWIQFKDVMLTADEPGEAEILFEAVEELKTKLDKLEKSKASMIDLERYGLGKDLLFITYMRDGVPEKIAFKPKSVVGSIEKFEFAADFAIPNQSSAE